MRVVCLKKSDRIYTCNSYLLLGDWNRVEDVNTVIDPGADGFIIDEIEHISTGFGKNPVAQIVLTHNHFDHASGITALKRRFGCRILAFSDGPGVDELLDDGHLFKAADGMLEVIHTPGHSSDSICLYAPELKALFSGDTQLNIRQPGGSYSSEFREALVKLSKREVRSIYSGHDAPVVRGARQRIRSSLEAVRGSEIRVFSPGG